MKELKRHSNRYFHDFQDRLESSHIEKWMGEVDLRVSSAQTQEDWESAIRHWNEVKAHVETHGEKISLAFHRNTSDEAAEAEEKRLHEELEPPYKSLSAKIRQKILHSPFRQGLEARFSPQYFIQLQVQQDAFLEKNVAFETKVNELLAAYTKLTGSGEFEVEGKKYPLPHYKKFAASPEPRVRRESLQNYSGWFQKNRDALEGVYEECANLRNQMGRELGHADYIPLAYQKMRRTDYGPAEVAQFRREIRDAVVPIAKKIRERQAKSLKSATVTAWDADFFPEWRASKVKVKVEEQVPTALKVYQTLSPRLGAHFQKMIDHDLIDVPARPGKAPGAFCTDFADYRVPFIFLNSVDEGSDVTTLLHESGHAFQAWESGGIDLMELRWPTLEACEVHSMGMEFLAHPYYAEFFEAEEAERFRKYHLAEMLLLLPYIAAVDEFQHRVYSGEAKGAEGRAKAWEELEKQYLPDLDFGDLGYWRRIRWLRQLHIFKHPFYYIDYAIAMTGALQLWTQSIRNKEAALENYIHLCKLGGTLPLKQFFKTGNLKTPFEVGVLKELMGEVLKIESLV